MNDPFESCPLKKDGEKRSTGAVVAARSRRFVGSVLVGFRSAIPAWKRTCGVSHAAELTGSVPIAGPCDLFRSHLKNAPRYNKHKAPGHWQSRPPCCPLSTGDPRQHGKHCTIMRGGGGQAAPDSPAWIPGG